MVSVFEKLCHKIDNETLVEQYIGNKPAEINVQLRKAPNCKPFNSIPYVYYEGALIVDKHRYGEFDSIRVQCLRAETLLKQHQNLNTVIKKVDTLRPYDYLSISIIGPKDDDFRNFSYPLMYETSDLYMPFFRINNLKTCSKVVVTVEKCRQIYIYDEGFYDMCKD